MKTRLISILSGGALLSAAALPAFADVTAQEIRDAFVDLYAASGARIDIGSETMSGGTLTLENFSATLKMPQDQGQISMSYPWVKLTEVGGTVEITLAPTMQIRGNSKPGTDKDAQFAAHLEADYKITASGTLDDLTLDTSAPSIKFALDSVTLKGKEMPVNAEVSAILAKSNYQITKLENNRRRYVGGSSLASFSFKVNAKSPSGNDFVTATGNIANMATVFSLELAKLSAEDMADPMAFFKLGFDGGGSLESGKFNFDVNGSGGAATISGDTGRAAFSLSPKSIGYDIAETGVKLDIASSQMPIPRVRAGYDELALSFSLPLSQESAPSDFSVKTALRGLTVDESIWSIIDPGQSLPRDPITFALDLSGKVMVLANLMDPKTLETLNGPPYLPVSASLNELTVSGLGALLTGNGSATVDLTSGKKIKGVPVPVGSIVLDLKGAYGLMDTLTQMGLVPNDTATGLKAMLGAFSKPVGEDHVTSKIEATADGAIMANGQRIQ